MDSKRAAEVLRGEAAKQFELWQRTTARAEAAEADAAACRKEYASLLAKSGDMSDRLVAAEAHVADLRGALEDTDRRLGNHHESSHIQRAAQSLLGEHCPICVEAPQVFIRNAEALARTPAQSLARVKAEALREAAAKLQKLVIQSRSSASSIYIEGLFSAQRLLNNMAQEYAEAEKEAANG